MTQETISLTRALTEVKHIRQWLDENVSFQPLGITIESGSKVLDSAQTPKDLEQTIQSDYDTYIAKLGRLRKLRSAIIKANASTMVTVGTETMCIMEAVDLKSTIQYEINLLQHLKETYTRVVEKVSSANALAESELTKQIQSVESSPSFTNEIKDGQITLLKLQQNTRKREILDPLNIVERIKKLEKRINDINVNIDYALSEVNATTMIEV